MTQQIEWVDPETQVIYLAEQSWGSYRMYASEKKARQYNKGIWLRDEAGRIVKNEDGGYATRPARIFKVYLEMEEIT